MNTRTFLKTLCLVPIGAVVEKLPGQGVLSVTEPMSNDWKRSITIQNQALCEAVDKTNRKKYLWPNGRYYPYP